MLVWGAGGGLGIVRGAAVRALRRQRHRRRLVGRQDRAGQASWAPPPSSTGASSRSPTPTPASASSTRSSASARPSARPTGGVDLRHRVRARRRRPPSSPACSCASTFGKIVICGATSGFTLDFDVRYLWMRQKRIIGSHFANAYQCHRANQLIIEGKIEPVLSRTFPFDECPAPHQMMKENQHVGKMVVLVGAEARGRGPRARERPSRGRSTARPTLVPAIRRRASASPASYPYTRGIHRDMYRGAPLVDPPVRRLRHGRGDQPPLPLPDRAGPGGALGGVRPAHPDGPRLRRPARRSARSAGWEWRSTRCADVEAMFDGIPLDAVSTSMTINAPAAVLVAMYARRRELQGRDAVADPRHRPERRAQGVRRPRHLHLPAAALAAAGRRPDRLVRRARRRASTPSRCRATTCARPAARRPRRWRFALANAIAYVEAVLERGVDVDDFAPAAVAGSSTRT